MRVLVVCSTFFLLNSTRALPVPDNGFSNTAPGPSVPTFFNFGGSSYDEIAKQQSFHFTPSRETSQLFNRESPKPEIQVGSGQSTGVVDSFALISGDVFQQASQFFPTNYVAQLFDMNKQVQQVGSSGASFPDSGKLSDKSPPSNLVTSFDILKQTAVASSQSQNSGQSSHDQRESSTGSSDDRENFSTRESFGHESSSSHAKGTNQNSEANDSASSQYENGHRIEASSQETIAKPAAVIEQDLSPVIDAFPAHVSQTPSSPSGGHIADTFPSSDVSQWSPGSSVRGERFSNGSKEQSQTNSNNSSAYNVGSNNSNSFAHKESHHDKQSSADGGASQHASQAQQGSESVQINGSNSTEKFKETKFVEG